ncbi:MAG: hypothetical protein II038_14425, partial [Lachnospiraceae bacterium]|nr:hypothetical protein [Lachnospiraceae bacterium]
MTNFNNKNRISGIYEIIIVCAMILSLFAFIQAQPFCNQVHAADSLYTEVAVSTNISTSENSSVSENDTASENSTSSTSENAGSDIHMEADIPESG